MYIFWQITQGRKKLISLLRQQIVNVSALEKKLNMCLVYIELFLALFGTCHFIWSYISVSAIFLSPGGERQVLLVGKATEPPEISSQEAQTEKTKRGLL